MKRNLFSRMMAIGLSAVLTFSNVDFRVFAADGEATPPKTITKIRELDESIAHQTLFVGDQEENIVFPDTLEVTLTYQEEKESKKKIEKTEEEEKPAGEASTEADSEEETDEVTEGDSEEEESAGGNTGDESGEPKQEGDGTTPEPGYEEPVTDEPEGGEPEGGDSDGGAPSEDTPAPAEDNSGASDDASEGSGEGLIGMIFPAMRVYAASDETDPDKGEEPEEPKTEPEVKPENKEGEPEEEQYEIVKEIVTITEDITIEDVKWELDKENSSFDKFSSDEAGAEFIYVPAISDIYEVEALLPTITVKILKEEVPLEYMVLEADGVRVEGNLPVGSTLQVTPIDISEAERLVDDPDRVVLFALDVCIMLDGEEIEPDESVKVTVTPPADIETEVLENDTFELVHFPDESEPETVDTQINDQGDLEFEMDSFSPLVGTGLRAAGNYDAEFADGKNFSQNVKVNFANAALITGNVSYVKLKLLGNIGGAAVKTQDGEITTEPFVIPETTEEIYITGIIEDAEGNTTAFTTWNFTDIPVYVAQGTGHTSGGGNGTYQIPSGFYGIQIETAEGYSPAKGAMGTNSYYVLEPQRDINDPVWTTSLITIENSMLDVTNPHFIVNWQDNRNYADMRPYTTDTSIDDHITDIQNSVSLYYKSGSEYVSVAENTSILVSAASLTPAVVGGPFSWTITFKKLPKFVTGETPYEWYIKLSDSFYDGKKSYYQLEGLNGDGYLRITESGNDVLTLTFTNSVTGSVNWRVGDVEPTEIPVLPDASLYSDAHTTMRLYKKVGSNPAVEVTSGYSIAWTETADRRTWEYSITGLPLYAANGDAILYYTVMESDASASYKYTYDNGLDSTETDKCLPGQKIYATSIGDAIFSFDKVWYDDNDQDSINRRESAISKNITFYLWRYPSNGTLADGAPVTYNAKQYSYKMTAGQGANPNHSLTIDLDDFAQYMGVENATFPKFDEQGFTYIYYATEVSGSELYKTVYWNGEGEFNGTSTDKAVLNNGKICNVRSGQIAPEVTKQWNVSAISDYVGSSCTFKLQRKEGSAWVDVDGAELTLSGFSSSKKKVTGVFGAQELYNRLGERYEYRVIESSVRAGSGESSIWEAETWTEESDGFSNLYTLKDYSYKAVTTYTTTVENGKETAKATVVNKLYGTKKLSVTKSWTGDWNIGTGNDLTGNIIIDLKRAVDGGAASLFATLYLDKPQESGATEGVYRVDYVDAELEDFTGTYRITNDGKTWKTEDIVVIAYTEDGQQYVYSVSERPITTTAQYGVETDKTVTGKRIDFSVINRIGGTNYRTRVDIRKIWKDDSDTSQRSNITAELGSYDLNGQFTPAIDHETGNPYVLTLTAARDYDWYIWVDGNDLKPEGSRETSEQAIANHLSIRLTDGYGRTILEPTFTALGESNKTITGGVVPAIVESGLNRPGYKVTVSRNTSGTGFTVTNTRAASRAFSFTKNWEDSANALGLRGDFLRVALFREVNDTEEEVAFIDIPTSNDTQSVTVNFTNAGQYYPAYDSNGNNYIYSVKEYICTGTPLEGETQCTGGAEPDAGSVVKTEVSISATKDTTTTGYVVERTTSDTVYSPIPGTYDLESASGVQSLLMTDSFEYTNRAAGQRSEVQFYVIWHDNAKSTERPDVYLTLYYDGGADGAIIPYTGSYTERWEDVEPGNKFVQKAVFSGLPAADDTGRVYTYYVTEHFNNATTTYKTEHYSVPLFADGSFNSDAVTWEEIGSIHQLVVKDGVEESSVADDGHKLTKEESFTLTSISDTVKVEGRKLWLGIPEGIEVGHLPGAYIYLFRDSDTDHTHALPDVSEGATQLAKMTAYGGACVDPMEDQGASAPAHEKYVLLNSTKSMYVFGTYKADGTVDTYTEFPKYDDLGYMYKYIVREVIYNSYDHELPAEIMIPNYSDNTTDLSNQYKLDAATNKRDLVVHKQWNIRKSEYQETVAKATFRLYRRELSSDGDTYHAFHYAEDDSSTADPASSASAAALFDLNNPELELLDEKTITSGDEEIIWENYQIFAPSGKLYGYYAVELTGDMPGYTVSLNGATDNEPTAGNTMISGGTMEAGDSYLGVAFANKGISLSQGSSANTKEEYFRNTYELNGFTKITFKKKWVAKKADGTTWAEMLPQIDDSVEPLTFSVYCIAKMQSSDKDNYDRINFPASAYTVTKAVDPSDSTIWIYTVTFNDVVPIYSANGNLYTYYVAETLNSDFVKKNYKADISYTYKAASGAVGDTLNITERVLTNSLKGSFGVQKIWDDFSNDYGMREGGITFDVYYSVGTEGSFTKYNNSSYTLSSSNKWATTISALPVTSNSSGNAGQYYQYRIIETGIKESGTSTITVNPPATGDPQTTKWAQNKTGVEDSGNYFASVTAGNYQVYNPADLTDISTSQTRKLVNQLDTSRAVVSLKVTKSWEDEGDAYGLRPSSITVAIQSSKDGGSNWTDVVTRSLTASDATDGNTWEKTFENLPKFFGTRESDKYLYRAVETKVGSAACTMTDTSALSGNGGAYSFAHVIAGDAENGFTVNITNTLRRMDKSIHVVKRWNSNDTGSEVTVALFSTNYTAGTAGTGTPSEISFATNRQNLNAGNSWACEYVNLPKYNEGGEPIRYYVKEITTGSFKTQYLSAAGTASDDLQYVSSETAEDFWAIVVNTPLTKVTGTKAWSDENDKYGLRPKSVVLTLQRRPWGTESDWTTVTFDELKKTNAAPSGVTKAADGSAVVTVKGTDWRATVDKLPLYALGDGTAQTKYQYRLAELSVPGGYVLDAESGGYEYGTDETAQTSKVTNVLVTRGNVTVTKVWNTTATSEKHDVTVKLLSRNLVSGTDTGTLTLVPGGLVTISGSGWNHVFENLPATNTTGNEIIYYVEEAEGTTFDTAYYVQTAPSTFAKVEKSAAKTSGTDEFEFRIVNTPLTSITGSKKWEDDDNGFGLRPDDIALILQRRVTGGDWENVTLEELRKTNSTDAPEVTVSDAENWKATIGNLPQYVLSDGLSPVKYTYRLAETAEVNAYSRRQSDDGTALTPDEGYVYGTDAGGQTSEVTNHLILRENDITVKKIWNTDADKSEVTVTLLSGNSTEGVDDPTGELEVVKKGTTEYVRTIGAADSWETAFEGLPLKNRDGQYIVYYVAETTDNGFSTEYYVDNGDGSGLNKVTSALQVKSSAENALLTQIVNTPKTTASVEKVWSDDSNRFGTRPDSIYVKLQRKTTEEENWTDVAGQAVIELGDAGSWRATVEDLPLYVEYSAGADPVRYEYRFLETDAAGNTFVPLGYSLVSAEAEYVQTNDGTEAGYVNTFASGAYKTVITNTLITKSITAVKIWDDNSDSHGIRPAQITLFVDEAVTGYVEYKGERITNVNLNVTPAKSSDGNTWTYVFTGLPKYAYGTRASAANPEEIAYTITEDVDTPYYPSGFVLKNYYLTTTEPGDAVTTITNTAMENDGVLLVEKQISPMSVGETIPTYAFPFMVSFTRPDDATVPYTGRYYLYEASYANDAIMADVNSGSPAMAWKELSTADGTIRIPSGYVAVLTGINSMYTYKVTENPVHAFYTVKEVSGADTSNRTVAIDSDNPDSKYGEAEGHISSTAARVRFVNQLMDISADTYLKVENTTDPVTNSQGEVLTGGEVKIFKSGVKVVDNPDEQASYDYVEDETPYIRQAVSIEFKPDTDHGYSYSNSLTISWWESGDDAQGEASHHISISGYVYTGADGKQHPYTGTLTKNNDGSITADSEFEQFASVWRPLLDGTQFKDLTVLEGSVVVTLASDVSDMPAKTLVQVEFVPPASPAPASSGGGSGSDSEKKDKKDETASATAVAMAVTDNKLLDQINRDGSIQGVRTGDDTPLTALIMLFMTFALGFAAVLGKYMRYKPGKR